MEEVPPHRIPQVFYFMHMQRTIFPSNEILSIPIDEDMVLESFAHTKYIAINKNLLCVYGPEMAVYISNLIDRYLHLKENNKLKDGWFIFKHEEQCKMLGMSEFKIRNCKKQLIEENVLIVKMIGNPAKEHYRINVRSLLTRINTCPLKTVGQDLQKLKGSNIFNKLNIFNTIYARTCVREKENLKEKKKNNIYLPLAKKLQQAIQSKKNISHTPAQIESWSKEIKRLIIQNKVSYERVENVIDWYGDNIGGQFIPVVESGSSLREKFSRLETAMERNGYYESDYSHSFDDNNQKLPERIRKLHMN